MKLCLLGALLLLISVEVRPEENDSSKAEAQVCVTTIGGPILEKETALWRYYGPGPGRRLMIHAEANVACGVFAAAFQHGTGNLVKWLPEFGEIAAGKGIVLPPPDRPWDWEKTEGAGPIDITVLVFDAHSSQDAELKKLVTAMHGTQNAALLVTQGRKLRELVSKIDQAGAEKGVRYESSGSIAGTFRSISEAPEFDWHAWAQKAKLSASQPASFLFSNAE